MYAIELVEFMGLQVAVAPGAFVPREETELLGRAALVAIGELGLSAPRVIDMCCGSGNLACAIASHVPGAEVWASDLSSLSVEVARGNVVKLGLQAQVHVHQGDLFHGFKGRALEGTIDVIVCNPPYISTRRLLEGDRAHLLEHEPREAFDGGPYGLQVHLRVLRQACAFLRPGGILLFEIGLGQHRQMQALFERTKAYDDVRQIMNPAGEVRVMRGRRRPDSVS